MLTVLVMSVVFGVGFGLSADAVILALYFLGVRLGWWD